MEQDILNRYREFHRKNPNLFLKEVLDESIILMEIFLSEPIVNKDDFNEAFSYLIYFANYITCLTANKYKVENPIDNEFVYSVPNYKQSYTLYYKDTQEPIFRTGIRQVERYNKYLSLYVKFRNCLAHPTSTDELYNIVTAILKMGNEKTRCYTINHIGEKADKVLEFTDKMEQYCMVLITTMSSRLTLFEKSKESICQNQRRNP